MADLEAAIVRVSTFAAVYGGGSAWFYGTGALWTGPSHAGDTLTPTTLAAWLMFGWVPAGTLALVAWGAARALASRPAAARLLALTMGAGTLGGLLLVFGKLAVDDAEQDHARDDAEAAAEESPVREPPLGAKRGAIRAFIAGYAEVGGPARALGVLCNQPGWKRIEREGHLDVEDRAAIEAAVEAAEAEGRPFALERARRGRVFLAVDDLGPGGAPALAAREDLDPGTLVSLAWEVREQLRGGDGVSGEDLAAMRAIARPMVGSRGSWEQTHAERILRWAAIESVDRGGLAVFIQEQSGRLGAQDLVELVTSEEVAGRLGEDGLHPDDLAAFRVLQFRLEAEGAPRRSLERLDQTLSRRSPPALEE